MKTLIFGGAGFVGLNIAEQMLIDGQEVLLFDRLDIPLAARSAFGRLAGRLTTAIGDVTDFDAVSRVLRSGIDTVVLGAAVTADAAREARDPEGILQVNVGAITPILRAARNGGVRRIVNLSSAAAYGSAAFGVPLVDEDVQPRPTGLYGISKAGAEMIGQRMAQLWSLDFVSLRLSAVFGPWERATGVRDTTSAPFQITEAARLHRPALLGRPGVRDWVYAPDVAKAVQLVARAGRLAHPVYNVSSPETWSALDWGQALATRRGGFDCRLAAIGEEPTISLHSEADRAPLSTRRLQDELGWTAGHGLAASVEHLDTWCRAFNP